MATETSLQYLQELLGQLQQTNGLDYSDPIISQVVNNLSPMADKVKEIDDQIDESVQKAELEAQKAKELEDKEKERIEKDWRLHHPIQATLRDWRKGLSDSLDGMTEWMKDDPNWAYIKGFGDAAFGILGDATFGAVEFGVDLAQYTHEGLTFGYNSLMGKETPQWMKDDLEGGKNALGEALLNTLGTAYGLVTMIPEVNDLINALDDSTRDGSLMGSILHDARHAKDLKQQPIRDKIKLVGQFSGYESGQAAGEIISEIVSFIGPTKLAKIAGKSKLVSRLSQVPKIEKGLSYIKQARTMLSDNYLSTLARESYGATKDFFRSRLGNLWDDLSYKKFSFAGLDDFRKGDDIGKHTARLYQSTGESAEFQRIRQKLYGEASEQSGRKVSREFSKEASEQLAKHSDEVAKSAKEAAEQAGKKVGREFSKEASEQLAKHGDEVAKGAKEAAEQVGKHTKEEFGEKAVENVSRDLSEPQSRFVGKLRGEDVMFRDKYKNEEYFLERKLFLEKSSREFISLQSTLPLDKKDLLNLYLAGDYRNLSKVLYSIGEDIESVFSCFKDSLSYYGLIYNESSGIFTMIDYLSLAVLFENRKEEFIDDVKILFDKYVQYSEEDESVQDGYIETLALYLLKGEVENFHSHLEYLNMIGNDADSVIEAQKFWYYAHSEASWYDTHKTDDAYYGYWSFDTAALCKMRGIYDERLKDLDFFPYDLLVQNDK
ncbi:transposase family protein [Streptococcus cristatus]|uniref:DUF1911 domain-containing protein n=2 Tax=Streptococcus cristatus TaxID=45634 RepID=A0ABM5NLL1_STRCR|nr:PoNe immunity protein domain-containing protein [Streptococcus cristatus]AGK71627.1 hypothetical protein I872_07735 [Streptococcus cristatus AS 1.3089]SQI48430.1 transposase family protein [Streptococcus cristatus]